MSRNLKPFLPGEVCYSADDVVEVLVESITGRSIGERFVIGVERVAGNSFVLEIDDGCQFKMTCEKLV